MNEFLQNHLITIIIFLLFIILLLIGLIGFVLIKLLMQNKQQIINVPAHAPDATAFQKTNFSKLVEEPVVEKFFCQNHPDAQSIGSCLICEDVYCENCLVEHEGLYFCKEHFKVFVSNQWRQITDVKTTPDTPIDGLYVYHFKRKIWKEDHIPSYVLTHYKINLEDDFIESFVQLNVIECDADKLEEDIKRFQAKLA